MHIITLQTIESIHSLNDVLFQIDYMAKMDLKVCVCILQSACITPHTSTFGSHGKGNATSSPLFHLILFQPTDFHQLKANSVISEKSGEFDY